MPKKPVKQTVAIDAALDPFIRETWALLVKDRGVGDATYSAALNFMLIGAVMEAANRKSGWLKGTKDTAWGFAHDNATLEQLKVHEALPAFRAQLEFEEGHGD